MRIATTIMLVALALAGCSRGASPDSGEAGNSAVAHGFVPPVTAPPSPLPGQAQTMPLAAYVGRYPKDPLDGVGFYDRTEVTKALDDAVGDDAIRRQVKESAGQQAPIFTRAGRVGAWGCTARDCSGRNWTMFIDAKGKGELCYHDAATMGESARWYAGNIAVMRQGVCPAGVAAATKPG